MAELLANGTLSSGLPYRVDSKWVDAIATDEEMLAWIKEIRRRLVEEGQQHEAANLSSGFEVHDGDRDTPDSNMDLECHMSHVLAHGCDEQPSPDVDTLIFQDVDGVLNIGIDDPGCGALMLSEDVVAHTRKTAKMWTPGRRENIMRVDAVINRELRHGDHTYADFACGTSANRIDFSDRLVRRLAYIICIAGENAKVVLSSKWRWPRHQSRVDLLQRAISKHLGRHFVFQARTTLCNEPLGADRLRVIGNYLAELGARRDVTRPLRVLVLDDFSITGFARGDMDTDGVTIRSPREGANYLRRRYYSSSKASKGARMDCAIVHTFDEWCTSDGLAVQVGAGLTLDCVCEAARFLGQACPQCPGLGPVTPGTADCAGCANDGDDSASEISASRGFLGGALARRVRKFGGVLSKVPAALRLRGKGKGVRPTART